MPVFISIVLFSSCTKHEGHEKLSLNFKNPAINQVFMQENLQLQKIMYNSLSPNEKVELWSKKLDAVLDLRRFSKVQRKFIMEVKEILNPNLFEYGNINNFDDQIIKQKAFELFGVDESRNILSSLSINNPELNFAQPTADCICSVESSWCGNIACGYDFCKEGSGCGTLFLYTCDGKCNRDKQTEL